MSLLSYFIQPSRQADKDMFITTWGFSTVDGYVVNVLILRITNFSVFLNKVSFLQCALITQVHLLAYTFDLVCEFYGFQ